MLPIEEQLKSCNTIGVVGKMASGKNYICSQLEQSGWTSLDADSLVHKAIEKLSPQIIETFLPYAKKSEITITTDDGKIDRRSLGKLLFSDSQLLAKQESIVYPEVISMTKEFISSHPKTIINATVLYKTPELLNLCDAVVYVKSSFFKRYKRAKKRDNLPPIQILRRFYSQRNLLSKYKSTGKTILFINN